jgi:hypothetical protein
MSTSRRSLFLRALLASVLVAGSLIGSRLSAQRASHSDALGSATDGAQAFALPQVLTTTEVPPTGPGDRGGRMTEGTPSERLTPREAALLEAAREARRQAGISEVAR